MAPKKAPKKVAKKTPSEHDPHKSANDARRTFEHLGRVQVLSSFTSSERDALDLLTKTADEAFRMQQYKESADLLRAAEHLSFAILHADSGEAVALDLKKVIKKEFEHLIERSAGHVSHHVVPKAILHLLTRLTGDGKSAMRRGSYRAALEFARGAEALSHVHDLGGKMFPPAMALKLLQSSR